MALVPVGIHRHCLLDEVVRVVVWHHHIGTVARTCLNLLFLFLLRLFLFLLLLSLLATKLIEEVNGSLGRQIVEVFGERVFGDDRGFVKSALLRVIFRVLWNLLSKEALGSEGYFLAVEAKLSEQVILAPLGKALERIHLQLLSWTDRLLCHLVEEMGQRV